MAKSKDSAQVREVLKNSCIKEKNIDEIQKYFYYFHRLDYRGEKVYFIE